MASTPTVVGELSTPNPAYFRRAEDMIGLSATHGMVVLLDPIETSSCLSVLRTHGKAKAFACVLHSASMPCT